jgi:hypothetical protein
MIPLQLYTRLGLRALHAGVDALLDAAAQTVTALFIFVFGS